MTPKEQDIKETENLIKNLSESLYKVYVKTSHEKLSLQDIAKVKSIIEDYLPYFIYKSKNKQDLLGVYNKSLEEIRLVRKWLGQDYHDRNRDISNELRQAKDDMEKLVIGIKKANVLNSIITLNDSLDKKETEVRNQIKALEKELEILK